MFAFEIQLVIIENKENIRYAEDNNGSSMGLYFPAIWIKSLQNGFYSSGYKDRPELTWEEYSVAWTPVGRTTWNQNNTTYIYCGLG